MSEDKKKAKVDTEVEKKDLTGILELASLSPPVVNPDDEDPFAVNVMQSIEQVDDFASIDTLGMIDHEPFADEAPELVAISPASEAQDLFPVSVDAGISPDSEDPFAASQHVEIQALDTNAAEQDPFQTSAIAAVNDFALPEMTYVPSPALAVENKVEQAASASGETHPSPPMDYLDELKSYSQKTQESAFEKGIKAPFHLSLQGSFDPYTRDKLLMFITENPIGLNSSELDLQLKAGRVLFPRISEFAGIKLIQDLRDSGLLFKLTPSSRDDDELIHEAPALSYRYESTAGAAPESMIPVLPEFGLDQKAWKVIDSVQMVQYLRAEILEVEKSDLFQNLIERMLVAMKKKAILKGADAMTGLTHQVTPLRLPSQYQVELRANLLKKL